MLIRICTVTLQTLSNGHTVKLEACDQHAKETAGLLVAEFAWYCMPVIVHSLTARCASRRRSQPPNRPAVERRARLLA